MKLVPLTKRANDILANKMGGNPDISVQMRVRDKVLFSSKDGKYCGWVDLRKDPDWIVILP